MSRISKIMCRQYQIIINKPFPYLLGIIDEVDSKKWYFMIGGLDTPFRHGEFIFKLLANDDFPHTPPRLEFITPNGVFETTGPICMSVGEFHAKDKPGKEGSYGWRSTLGMPGFALQVVNMMICHDSSINGIGIKIMNNEYKQNAAKSSRDFNQKNFPKIYELFEEFIKINPDMEPVRNIVRARENIHDITEKVETLS
ncbi:ubiquitin-conjugating enzyme E2 J2-like [Hydra vulgaris]|uniref:Ubiquitin-conjugating enzyme E2 J2-like n=1 Tax=Hydra vulgaris TaxID=6087 RepID=A0ABM4C586_HYDVU